MWLRDLYKPYIRPHASEREQLWFGRIVAVIGLAIGVTLGLLTIEKGVPNLTGLFSLQNTTPIHVAPAVWLGLHWNGLRGEAVAAGMLTGLATTIGLVFSPVNVRLAVGLDQTACGLSTAMIGFFVNLTVTVLLGLVLQYKPSIFGQAAAAIRTAAPALDHINLGRVRDPLTNPYMWAVLVTALLFTVPFYRVPLTPDVFVGDMACWAFVALVLSGVLAILVASAYIYLWQDYVPVDDKLGAAKDGTAAKSVDQGAAAPTPAADPSTSATVAVA
jgi:hypothetical protein